MDTSVLAPARTAVGSPVEDFDSYFKVSLFEAVCGSKFHQVPSKAIFLQLGDMSTPQPVFACSESRRELLLLPSADQRFQGPKSNFDFKYGRTHNHEDSQRNLDWSTWPKPRNQTSYGSPKDDEKLVDNNESQRPHPKISLCETAKSQNPLPDMDTNAANDDLDSNHYGAAKSQDPLPDMDTNAATDDDNSDQYETDHFEADSDITPDGFISDDSDHNTSNTSYDQPISDDDY